MLAYIADHIHVLDQDTVAKIRVRAVRLADEDSYEKDESRDLIDMILKEIRKKEEVMRNRSTAASSTDPMPSSSPPECVLCMEREATWVFNNCGHAVYCKPCSRRANANKAKKECPICRTAGKAVAIANFKGDVYYP